MDVLLTGVMIAGGMIMAIGAQNAFVLKQGLLKRNVFWVVSICFICDFVLMTIGTLGLGSIISSSFQAKIILAMIGGVFLTGYGIRAFINAIKATSFLDIHSGKNVSTGIKTTIMATLAITLLNPHVYLDTVVIVGSIAGTLSFEHKLLFLLGAVSVSFCWFFGLGYGARFLLPLFKNAKAWQILDFIIAVVMGWIAYELFKFAFTLYQSI